MPFCGVLEPHGVPDFDFFTGILAHLLKKRFPVQNLALNVSRIVSAGMERETKIRIAL